MPLWLHFVMFNVAVAYSAGCAYLYARTRKPGWAAGLVVAVLYATMLMLTM